MTTQLIGVGLFEMVLDGESLPIQVDVSRNLHAHLEPRDFSEAARTGYLVALWRHNAPIIARGDFTALSQRPPRRAELITLLDCQSLEQIESIESAAGGFTTYEAQGPTTDFGSPSMTVTAALRRLEDIRIDPNWAAATTPSYIGYDIVECANSIRAQRPKFHEDGTWAARTTEELEIELMEYKAYLQRNL